MNSMQWALYVATRGRFIISNADYFVSKGIKGVNNNAHVYVLKQSRVGLLVVLFFLEMA